MKTRSPGGIVTKHLFRKKQPIRSQFPHDLTQTPRFPAFRTFLRRTGVCTGRGSRASDGTIELLGATQGYDENGFAIRGSIPLEAGMTIRPLFTAVSSDGTEREYEGEAITVPAEGLTLQWSRIPAGKYAYCFGLTDLAGEVHYTDSVDIHF